MRYPESMNDDRWELIPGIWNNLKASPLISLDNVLMAKQAIFPLSSRLNRSFVEFHFDLHAYILFQMPKSLCGDWSCLRNEVIQLTSRAQPRARSRDSQGRRADWSVLMCFLEQAHFLTSIGSCYVNFQEELDFFASLSITCYEVSK